MKFQALLRTVLFTLGVVTAAGDIFGHLAKTAHDGLSSYRLSASPSEVASVTSPHVAPSLFRQPYLQRVTADSAVVVWATVEPGPAEVRYRPEQGGVMRVAAAVTRFFSAAQTSMSVGYYQHEAALTGLTSATTYRYDVFVNGSDLTPLSDLLTTAPANRSGAVSFVVFGDSGSGTDNQQAIADLIGAEFRANRWDLAIHTGDIVYPRGSYQLLHDRFFAVYNEWLRRRPIFFAPGNHEYYVQDGQPYLDLFAMPENGHDPMAPGYRERYYSFDYGPIHFVALDTNSFLGNAPRQQHLTWLARDLEATTQPWKIVFMHIPAHGSTADFSNPTLRSTLQPVFERYGVQLVLAGHHHSYARGGPWRERTTPYPAVMYMVSGGGGAGLTEANAGAWLVHAARAFHFVSVTVTDCAPARPCELTLEAIDRDGQRLDAYTFPLRAQQQDAAAPQVAWIGPPPGAVVSGATQISATAQDDQQVVKVDLWVDGTLRLVDSAPPYEWLWDTTTELNGAHVLELRVADIAGRVVASEPRTVRVSNPGASVRLLSPYPTETVMTGMPFMIRWLAANGAQPITTFRVEVSADGKIYQPLAGCTSLPATARECLWNTPGPASKNAAVRITAFDAAGPADTDLTQGFKIQAGTPTLRVTFPNKATTLGLQSWQSLAWTNTLGLSPVKVELSRDKGGSWEVLAPALLPLNGDLAWTVAGPPTTQGLLRVSSLNSSLQDVSDVPFTIAPVSVTLTAPKAATIWRHGTEASVKWKGSLGTYDRFNVRLSTDGGATFPIVLAGSVAANAISARFKVPAVTTETARVKLESLSNPGWNVVGTVNFKILPP